MSALRRLPEKAALYGFVVVMLLIMILVLLADGFPQQLVPVQYVNSILLAGIATFLISDIWLRRMGDFAS